MSASKEVQLAPLATSGQKRTWPAALSPQHLTSPLVDNAHVCFNPIETEIIVGRPEMSVEGAVVGFVVPSPSCKER